MQYFNDKGIPLTNLIYISLDVATDMTGGVKGFVSRMKSVACHISHVHCIVHRQHLAAKIIEGDMEKALNASTHITDFVKANSVNGLRSSVKLKSSKHFCITQK